jgi:hypothetical protein
VIKKECNCSMRVKLTGDGCEICNPERAEELSGYQRIVPNITEMVKEAQGEPMLEAVEADWEAFDSAAPELLEALELLVDTYEDGGWPSAAIVIAKAAIAKAKGESIR